MHDTTASENFDCSPMRAAAMPYCIACMARLTGLRAQVRAKRVARIAVWRSQDAPSMPLAQALLPDLSDAPSQPASGSIGFQQSRQQQRTTYPRPGNMRRLSLTAAAPQKSWTPSQTAARCHYKCRES